MQHDAPDEAGYLSCLGAFCIAHRLSAFRATVSGTDSSTGKPVRLLLMQISRITGGEIVEAWQLGVPAEEKGGA